MDNQDPKNTRDGAPENQAIEDALIDAMSGGPIGPALAAWLETHPEDAAELDAIRAISMEILDDRAATDPGDHFFEALHEDITRKIAEPAPATQVLTGGPVTDAPKASTGWLDRLSGWFASSPTAAWAGVMALALMAIAVWTLTDGFDPNKGALPVVHTTDAGDTRPEEAVAQIVAPLETELPQNELAELQKMAAQLDLGQEDGQWDEDNGEDTWRSAPPSAELEGLSIEELQELDRALSRTL